MIGQVDAQRLPFSDDLEFAEEETPLLSQSLKRRSEQRRSPFLSLGSFFAGLLCLIVAAGMVMRYRVNMSSALNQPASFPSEVVLLSGHMGPKFFGLEPILALNKARFAEINQLPLYLAEDFLGKDGAANSLPLESDFFRIKFQMALDIFAQRGPSTKWAVWVDGDAWLNEARVNLSQHLHLGENEGKDLIVGTELPGMNSSADLPACTSINMGVFAVRNSPTSIAVMKRLLALNPAQYKMDHYDDQCAIKTLWSQDPTTRQRALVLGSADTGRHLQCRTRRKCKKYFPDLCCSAESWNIQWPASDWHDIAERIIEEEAGTDIVTNAAHALEVDACNIATWVEGKPISACEQILAS